MGFRALDSTRPVRYRLHVVFSLLAASSAVIAGCSGDGGGGDRGPDPAGAGGGVSGGSGGSGGAAGGSSTAGAGGAGSGGAGGADAGAVDGGVDAGSCNFQGTPIDPSSLPSCESDTCQDAHCLPRTAITPEQADLLDDCDEDNECVPDLLIRTLGQFLLETCESLGGAEGRCISTCVPQVADQLDVLPKDSCEDGERCAPCYDPVTGEDTGACGQSCDEGPTEDPYTFDECCGGLSVCVPEELVPEDQRGMLDAKGCSGRDVLCAPKQMASDRDFVPESCESLAGAEGRCLPACLPDVARQADRLPKDDCDDGELCAPCFDPVTGDETGACSVADDEPEDDPVVFDECCGGAATCVPEALVPDDQKDLLDANTCTGTDVLCAPKDIAAGTYEPDSCTSWGGAEGRCLLACLPDVAARADQLSQDDCGDAELCVPCYDPLTGEDTSACTLEGDEPEEDPYEFPTCCDDGDGNDLGTCVPTALVPEDQRAMLSAETCSDAGFLCAPTALATGSYTPISCTSLAGAEGRCMPACLPDVQAQAAVLPQDDCAQGFLCAPCYDPITGDSTGSCELEGDAPEDDPVLFPGCCDDGAGNDLGACVPSVLVPVDQQAMLSAETCAGSGVLCAPKDLASGSYEPQACESWNDAEGRCLPACLPDVQAQASQLTQDVCGQGKLCVPCYDPLTGEDTGSCRLEGDEPEDPAYTFPGCCDDGADGELGTCVPQALVSVEQQSLLGQDSCDTGSLCAPTTIARGEYEPDDCDSWGDAEGRCLPECLPAIQAQADQLTQDDCGQGELCAPCYDPLTGLLTGSCNLEGDVPVETPYTFPLCCDDGDGGDLGTCVPTSLVPPEQQPLLGQDSCGAGSLCAPTPIAHGEYEPETCHSWGGGEGRCLPACLPPVQVQADRLTPDLCGQGELCVPCTDPVTGVPTGSCLLEGDTPDEPVYTFPTCCDDGAGGDLGTCVPTSLVPGDQQAMLGQDSCSAGSLCAPTPIAAGNYEPESCESWGGGEGRCLPSCLPDIQAQADRLERGSCGQGELCAPCYDPLSGEDTGACTLEGDEPVDDPPYLFPGCCDDGTGADLGTCVPGALVPAEQQPLLGADSCSDEGFLCAPTDIANDAYAPIDCNSWLGAEGRCLPECLPPVEAQASALQDPASDGCAQGRLCVPCYSQVDGSSTGACEIEPDAPTEVARTFPRCCPTNSVDRGTCVPALAAGSDAASLPNLNCETLTNDADDYVCAPTEKVVDPAHVFPSCTTVFAGPACPPFDFICSFARSTAQGYIQGKAGACLPSCFLSEQSTAIPFYGTFSTDQLYGQSTCATGEDCGPCVYPEGHAQAGASTGLCD